MALDPKTAEQDIGPPRTIVDVFARKERARQRFDGMTLIEKMEMAIEMYRDREKLTRKADQTARVRSPTDRPISLS